MRPHVACTCGQLGEEAITQGTLVYRLCSPLRCLVCDRSPLCSRHDELN